MNQYFIIQPNIDSYYEASVKRKQYITGSDIETPVDSRCKKIRRSKKSAQDNIGREVFMDGSDTDADLPTIALSAPNEKG